MAQILDLWCTSAVIGKHLLPSGWENKPEYEPVQGSPLLEWLHIKTFLALLPHFLLLVTGKKLNTVGWFQIDWSMTKALGDSLSCREDFWVLSCEEKRKAGNQLPPIYVYSCSSFTEITTTSESLQVWFQSFLKVSSSEQLSLLPAVMATASKKKIKNKKPKKKKPPVCLTVTLSYKD